MTALRSAAFGVLLYGYLILFLLVFLPVFHFSGDDFAWQMTRRWGRSAMRLHRRVVGTRAAFEGLEHIPAGASIVASKHQSYWETLGFVTVLDRPAFILKKELMRLPLFGTYMRRLGMIPVDRTRRGATMQSMMEGARRAAAEGRPVVIFPEGTRTVPGVAVDPRPGVFFLYDALKVPVVPAALNSGLFWPRDKGLYRPGTIRVRFMPPIPPGLERAAFLPRLKAEMEAGALDLLAEAHADDPGLPLPDAAVEALAAGDAVQRRETTASSQRSVSPRPTISANEERT